MIVPREPGTERGGGVPKMKTRSAVAKRFRPTGSGRLKRKRQNLRHLLEKKPKDTKKKNGKADYVHPSDMRQMRRCLPDAF